MSAAQMPWMNSQWEGEQNSSPADCTLRTAARPIEITPKKVIAEVTYNGQCSGPLLRFKEGQQVTVDVFNDTHSPEQTIIGLAIRAALSAGAAERARPSSPVPRSDAWFSHFLPPVSDLSTDTRAGANLAAGQYSGQLGPVYIERCRRLNMKLTDGTIQTALFPFQPLRAGESVDESCL